MTVRPLGGVLSDQRNISVTGAVLGISHAREREREREGRRGERGTEGEKERERRKNINGLGYGRPI